MKKYKYIYIDLDHTLWDYKINSKEALKEMFYLHFLHNRLTIDDFISCFERNNLKYWTMYRNTEITKDKLRLERFKSTLIDCKINDNILAAKLSDDYTRISPQKTNLIPYAKEILEYLRGSYYLYILTNGFSDVQRRKLKNSGLAEFFEKIITSDEVGYAKPHKKIFHYAVSSVNAKKESCLMIGDDLAADILGAKNYGIDQVYFNPKNNPVHEKITYSISSLIELTDIL